MMLCRATNISRGKISSRQIRAASDALRTVLGIETSCDDTACAIIDENRQVRGEFAVSQLNAHLKSGGVVPVVARNLHNEQINHVVVKTLKAAKMSIKDVSAIAVTNRPGLPLSLHVGLTYAKKLVLRNRKPLIPIHHMEAHALIGMLCNPELRFPFLSLLLSGGHAQLAFARGLDDFLLLGESVDDAPGEVMDKVARRLKVRNLGPPFDQMSGGAAIERIARHGDCKAYFNRATAIPMRGYRNCNFSFAGFKDIVNLIDKLECDLPDLPPDQPIPQFVDIAASLQYAMTHHVLERLQRAVMFLEVSNLQSSKSGSTVTICDVYNYNQNCLPLNLDIVVSGGVASSDYITGAVDKFCRSYEGIFESTKLKLTVPRPKKMCADNGIMIAWNGLLKLLTNDVAKNTLYSGNQIDDVVTDKNAKLGVDIREIVEKAAIKSSPIKTAICLA